MQNSKIISNDIELLNLMISDAARSPGVYQPGPYWLSKANASVKAIKELGLDHFRGSENGAATSYGDNAYIDIRCSWNKGLLRLFRKLYRDIFPFNKLFEDQVCLTRSYFDQSVNLRTELYKNSKRVKRLLENYVVPDDNCKGGALSFGIFDGKKISHHYLQMIDTLDVISTKIDLSGIRSFFEIGGGFGVNTHIMVENYPNIKKIIYLDIPPNLYVGTQYLESFYGSNVITYKETRSVGEISFSPNDELEIICITPEQIELLRCEIDLFHNAHSFVEMPKPVVKNYAKHVERLLSKKNGCIALVSYDAYDPATTFPPGELPNQFSGKFCEFVQETLSPGRNNLFYVRRDTF